MIDNTPTYFTLRVGYSCNNRCIHCFVEKKKVVEDLTEDDLKAVIDTVPKGSIICFTGGEPTIRYDLQRLMKYSSDKGFLNAIQSNGVKFADMDYLKSLEPYLESITLPVHSNDPEIFDKITQVPGSFIQTMVAFKNLINSSIIVTTQTVINQFNYKTLLATFDMIQTIAPGVGMTLTFPHPYGAAHTTDVVPRLSEVGPYIQPVLKKYGHLMHTHYIPRCYLYPYQNIVVNVDEHDNGSRFKPGTDYLEGSGWERLDYGAYKKESKIKATTCSECIFNDECIGIWVEYGELYPELDLPAVKEDTNTDESLKHPKEEERSPEGMKPIRYFRLKDKSEPYLIAMAPKNSRCRINDKVTGNIIEDRHPLDSSKLGLVPETLEALRDTGITWEESSASLMYGKVEYYFLVYKRTVYKLSSLDTDLIPITKNIMVQMSLTAKPTVVWYICASPTAQEFDCVQRYFEKRDALGDFDHLKELMEETQLTSFALGDINGENCIYLF